MNVLFARRRTLHARFPADFRRTSPRLREKVSYCASLIGSPADWFRLVAQFFCVRFRGTDEAYLAVFNLRHTFCSICAKVRFYARHGPIAGPVHAMRGISSKNPTYWRITGQILPAKKRQIIESAPEHFLVKIALTPA